MRARVETTSSSLLVFTVLAQAATGASLMRVLLPWVLADRTPPARVAALTDPLLPAAAGLLALALLAALLHLGRGRAARFAVSHVRTSWLSREILLGSVFGGALGLELVRGWLGHERPALGGALVPLTALLGLLFVHAIVRVYRIRTVPAWDTWATPFAFFSATLLLGAVAAAIVLVLGDAPTDLASAGLRVVGLIALPLAAGEILVMVLHLRSLARRGGAAADSARIVQQEHPGRIALRTSCCVVGGILLFGTTWPGQGVQAAPAILFACGLLFLSELLARSLFYASHRRVGL